MSRVSANLHLRAVPARQRIGLQNRLRGSLSDHFAVM